MNPIETIAIAKVVGEKAEDEVRKAVTSGSYVTDFWLHVRGSVDVGDDYIRKVPQKACPWNLFAVALSQPTDNSERTCDAVAITTSKWK